LYEESAKTARKIA